MDSAVWGMIGTLAGAVVGSAASIFATWRASTVSYRMHDDKQKEERVERAKEFQRTTLLDLQEALYDAMRLSARAHHEDFMAHKAGAEWAKGLLTDEVSQGTLAANRRIAILVERVADAALRLEVKALTQQMTSITMQTEQQVAERLLMQVTDEFNSVVERLGTVLRSYY